MKTHHLSRIAGALVLALGLSTSAMAADTSSAMRGKILTPAGSPADNVKIKILHVPSGTVKEFSTNGDGSFVAKGLRVGGPYKVIIDSDTFKDTTLENVFLQLGDTYRLNTTLEPITAERITVTGSRFIQTAGGSNSVFGSETIANMPSFNRDIKDVARLNPLASINGNGEMVIAGGNPRSNSLTVDGIGQNDDFGLNYGGYPTAQPPVALDAIDQISVDVSPFSAKKGNFGGGTINAVTKSGSNEFKFSSFAETSTPSMAGDVKKINTVTETYIDYKGREKVRNKLDENGHRTYEISKVAPIETVTRFGFNVGGPILEDKLFYFVNYSNWSSKLALDYGFDGSGTTNEYNVTKSQFDEFNQILGNVYNLSDSLGGDPKDTNETLLVKLSWNINDDHRADFTYQWQDDKDQRNFGTGGEVVNLNSGRYDYVTSFNNFATKIYSDWSDDFSTEIGVSYKDVESNSDTNSDIGSVKVFIDGGRGAGFQFGTDQFRHANASQTKNLIVSADATYLYGDHEINFGAQFERLSLYNLFAANSLGSWTFDDFDLFKDQKINSYDFTYANAYTNNPADTAYEAVRKQLSLYVEDTFYIDDFTITAGVRYERLSSDDKPTLNTAFEDTYGFSNQENLDGLDIILPRVNVEWTVTDDLTLTAGVGRFQGGIPNVWYNNPFQNDGLTLVSASNNVINDYYGVNQVSADFSVPQDIKDSLTQGSGSTNYTDPNFKLPSSWRTSIGAEYSFDIDGIGDDFKLSAEVMYHVKENEAVWKNTALVKNGLAADGERVIYGSRYTGDLDNNFDIMMTNAKNDGRAIIFSTSLAKYWDNGLGMTLSYAHQDVEENHAGSSSRAQSNYKHNVIQSRNVDFVARGNYEVEHSLKLNLSYVTELFEGYDTRFNMFFERRSGRPYSWTMGMYKDGDFGDTTDFYSNSAYLAYIPSGADDPNVNWEQSHITWDELEVFLNKAGISERGEILDRNTGTQPWVTTMDISIKQEFAGFADGHKGQIYFMIDNFANLLNSDWGIERKLTYPNKSIYDFGGLDSEGRYKIDGVYKGGDVRNYGTIDSRSSAWQIKVGVNYKF